MSHSGSQTNMLRWRQKATVGPIVCGERYVEGKWQPTQAQIEAARTLAHELFAHECFAFTGEGYKPHSPRCEDAAQKIATLAAAAEAEDGSHERADKMRREFNSVANHTIEWCAQVADRYIGTYGGAIEIAAAIRAMKDKL